MAEQFYPNIDTVLPARPPNNVSNKKLIDGGTLASIKNNLRKSFAFLSSVSP